MPDPVAVLDASALIAVLMDEAGSQEVVPLLAEAAMSTVNWSEVVQRSLDHGVALTPAELRRNVEGMGVELHAFTAAQAEAAGTLRAATRHLGLSLGDRACLALALELGVPALTGDRAWSSLSLPIPVRVVR